MCRPIRVVAANAVGRVEGRGGSARVSWLQRVDGIGLNENLKLRIRGSREHAHHELAGNLRRDHIVGDAVGDFAGVERGRDEAQ